MTLHSKRKSSAMLASASLDYGTDSKGSSRKIAPKNMDFNIWLAICCNAVSKRSASNVSMFLKQVKKDKCWPRDSSDYIVLRNHLRIHHRFKSEQDMIDSISCFEKAWEKYCQDQILKEQDNNYMH